MLSQFHCICCAIEQFAIVLKVLSDLLMFSFKLFKAQSLFYPPGCRSGGSVWFSGETNGVSVVSNKVQRGLQKTDCQ